MPLLGVSTTSLQPTTAPIATLTRSGSLRKGGFKKGEKGKDKANATEDTPDPPETANIANEFVSCSAMQRIHTYLWSQPEDSGRNTLIIDSGASSHIIPHRSWFRTYRPLHPPRPVTLGDNSNAMAIGIGTVPLISQTSGTNYEIVLSNVLLIPEFRISHTLSNKIVAMFVCFEACPV